MRLRLFRMGLTQSNGFDIPYRFDPFMSFSQLPLEHSDVECGPGSLAMQDVLESFHVRRNNSPQSPSMVIHVMRRLLS